jgi:hypothetical protein
MGKMKVRRVERMVPLSDSRTTGRVIPVPAGILTGCGGLEIAWIRWLRTGEFLIINNFSTRNSCESQERRMISASGSSMNFLGGSSFRVDGGGDIEGD